MSDENRTDHENAIDSRMQHDTLRCTHKAERVRQWYRNNARAFLAEFTPERVREFDRDHARIDALESTLAARGRRLFAEPACSGSLAMSD